MHPNTTGRDAASPQDHPTARRPFLRALAAAAGMVGIGGVPTLAGGAAGAIPGVGIEFKRCHVAFVSNASALDAIAVYYADRNGDRNARYDIAPTVTDSRGYAPLVVEYDAEEDRTQIQLAEPQGALVCVIAGSGVASRSTNPNSKRSLQPTRRSISGIEHSEIVPPHSSSLSEHRPIMGEGFTLLTDS